MKINDIIRLRKNKIFFDLELSATQPYTIKEIKQYGTKTYFELDGIPQSIFHSKIFTAC